MISGTAGRDVCPRSGTRLQCLEEIVPKNVYGARLFICGAAAGPLENRSFGLVLTTFQTQAQTVGVSEIEHGLLRAMLVEIVASSAHRECF